jgi:hypothetical protein
LDLLPEDLPEPASVGHRRATQAAEIDRDAEAVESVEVAV